MSKRHQAYSLLYLNKMGSNQKLNRKLTQSRIESYQQVPFTTVDDIDDAILQKGMYGLLDTYSNKIKKYKNSYDLIPKTVRAYNSKRSRQNESNSKLNKDIESKFDCVRVN